MKPVVLIAHNLRSCHNVGSLLRTAEGLGIEKVWLTGYTPYPLAEHDTRMPHLARKLHTQIHKTALGAEDMVAWEHEEYIESIVATLKRDGYEIVALEQTEASIPLPAFKPSHKTALIVGREVQGIEPELLALCDKIVEIPMHGKKESFNVAAAAAMALYHISTRDWPSN